MINIKPDFDDPEYIKKKKQWESHLKRIKRSCRAVESNIPQYIKDLLPYVRENNLIKSLRTVDPNMWIYIHGPVGTGKTVGSCLHCLNSAMNFFYIRSQYFTNYDDDKTGKAMLSNILILDDFGKENVKLRWKIENLVYEKYENNNVLIFTSNYEIDKIQMNEAVIDRILERAIIICASERMRKCQTITG